MDSQECSIPSQLRAGLFFSLCLHLCISLRMHLCLQSISSLIGPFLVLLSLPSLHLLFLPLVYPSLPSFLCHSAFVSLLISLLCLCVFVSSVFLCPHLLHLSVSLLLGIEPRSSHILGKHSPTELYPSILPCCPSPYLHFPSLLCPTGI